MSPVGSGHRVLDGATALLHRARAGVSSGGAARIRPYRGYGTSDTLYLTGRVLRGDPPPSSHADDSRWRNLRHVFRRLTTIAVPGARVRASIEGAEATVVTDSTGYFEVALSVGTPAGLGEAWRPALLELLDPCPSGAPVSATGVAIVPPRGARFGVISDVDDTVIEADVANISRMLRLVMLTNARTRLAIAGVPAFYRALHDGVSGPFTNPVFYVSSSPWNFYDLLEDIIDVQDLPAGPLFLKDFGVNRELILSRGHDAHKLTAIRGIFEAQARMRFVLVGDSGQRDPEIYREVVRQYPGRVLAVFIRDIGRGERDEELRAIAGDLAGLGVEMVLARDTVTAAEHAARLGLIEPGALATVRSATGVCREARD